MTRNKSFDVPTVLKHSREVFCSRGYHATSIDDLVKATTLKRGSLYQAFGSKLGIFTAALTDQLEQDPAAEQPETLDLLAICCLELPSNAAVHDAIETQPQLDVAPTATSALAGTLGSHLLDRFATDAQTND